MKSYLLAIFIVAASTVAMAASETGGKQGEQTRLSSASLTQHRAAATQPSEKTSVAAMPGDINCGFVCDSFGRCRRVCW
jgi:hypothetical protein